MSMEFVNQYGAPVQQTGFSAPYYPQQQYGYQQQQPVQMPPQQFMNPENYNTPSLVSGNSAFSFKYDKETQSKSTLHGETETDAEIAKKKRHPKKKDEVGPDIARSSDNGVVEELPTMYTYGETVGMLKETLVQIDSLNAELVKHFQDVASSRVIKNKYNIINGLSENIGSLISNRIGAIKEINNSISKANDLDYKREKDRKAAASNIDDDKKIADLYKGFVQNMGPLTPQFPSVDPAIFGSGIVRADLRSTGGNINGNLSDVSYLSYMSNLTPEQNLMRYEDNPNVKQVLVFDQSNGNRFFQMMDVSTGTVIPNVPTYDQMFLSEFTIDVDKKIAKSINLNEVMPLVIINEGVASQY